MKTSLTATFVAVALLVGISTASAQEKSTWKPGVYRGTVIDLSDPNRTAKVEFNIGKNYSVTVEKGNRACRPGATLPLQVAKSDGDEFVLISAGDDVVRGCEKTFTLKFQGDAITGTMQGDLIWKLDARAVQ